VLSDPTAEPELLGLTGLADDAIAAAELTGAGGADTVAALVGVPAKELAGTVAGSADGRLCPEQPTASTETKAAAMANGALPRFMR
jgi:hypothetical protein